MEVGLRVKQCLEIDLSASSQSPAKLKSVFLFARATPNQVIRTTVRLQLIALYNFP